VRVPQTERHVRLAAVVDPQVHQRARVERHQRRPRELDAHDAAGDREVEMHPRGRRLRLLELLVGRVEECDLLGL